MRGLQTKIALFFIVVGLLMWFLYPRELFLAMVYEDEQDLTQAEIYYTNILAKRPHHKEAVFRLSRLYDRMARPERAVPHLQKLFDLRKSDWDVAEFFLEHQNNMGALDDVHQLEIEIARRFKKNPRHHMGRVVELYESAIEKAMWQNESELAYELLLELIPLVKDPSYLKYRVRQLDYGLKRTEKVIKSLRQILSADPADLEAYDELVRVYWASGQQALAMQTADSGLELHPKARNLLALKLLMLEKSQNWDEYEKTASVYIPLLKNEHEIYKNKLRLVSVLTYLDKKPEALNLLNEILSLKHKYPESRRDFIQVLGDLGDKEMLADELRQFASDYPEDTLALKALAEVLLYDLHDLSAIDVYLLAVQKLSSEELALSVAWAFADKNQKLEALDWIKKVKPFLKSSRQLISTEVSLLGDLKKYADIVQLLSGRSDLTTRESRLLAESYIELKQDDLALVFFEKILATEPDVDLALYVAYLQSRSGNREQAKKTLATILNYSKDKQAALLLVGKQMLFLGDPGQAMHYLRQADDIRTDHPEVLYWWSQALEASDEPKLSKKMIRRIDRLFKNRKPITSEEKRIALKTAGLINFSPELSEKYLQWLAHDPKNFDVRADYIDLLVRNKKLKETESQIAELRRWHPDEIEAVASYQVRLEMARHRWMQAITQLDIILQRNPHEWSYRRDKAYASERAGLWKRALQEYEAVYQATGNDMKVLPKLIELHEKYDNQVSVDFDWVKFGSESYDRYTLGLRQALGERFLLYINPAWQRYRSGFSAEEDQAFWTNFKLDFDVTRQLKITPFLQIAHSPHRTEWGGGMDFQISHEDYFTVQVGGQLNTLRVDLPSALATGSLTDQAHLKIDFPIVPRLSASLGYALTNTRLSSGDDAQTHAVDAFLNWKFWDRPDLTLGYQWQFDRTQGPASFFAALPLIEKSHAHLFNLQISHTFWESLRVNASFFVGEDFDRNLNLFSGDLWGGRVQIDQRVNRWLRAQLGYDYGRETLTGVSGESHHVHLQLVGHWF